MGLKMVTRLRWSIVDAVAISLRERETVVEKVKEDDSVMVEVWRQRGH